jgi:HEAT repeat protein
MRTQLLIIGMLFSSSLAFAGRGGSTLAIEAAVQSGSDDAIVAEIERAEELACLSCIAPVMQLVDYPSARVRDVAGWWLSRRGARDVVIAQMTARFLQQDPIAARNAADVLGGIRDFTTLSALIGYLAHPLDEESGAAAARAIGAIGHPSAVPALVGALSSSLAGVRVAAAAALRNLRAPSGQKTITAGSALLALLTDGTIGVRRQAAYSCGYLKDVTTVSALAQVLSSDASPIVRKAAAWALGQIGSGAALPALSAASVSDADSSVRSIATAAMGRLQ